MAKKMKMTLLSWILFILVIVGAINWGLVGIFNFNLVETLLGQWPMVVRVIYGAVGVAGLWILIVALMSGKR